MAQGVGKIFINKNSKGNGPNQIRIKPASEKFNPGKSDQIVIVRIQRYDPTDPMAAPEFLPNGSKNPDAGFVSYDINLNVVEWDSKDAHIQIPFY